MSKRVRQLASLVALACAGTMANAQGAATVDPHAAEFGAREDARHLGLSPSGKRVVYISPSKGSNSVGMTAELATGEVKPFIVASQPGERLDWCRFVTDERLICRHSALPRVNSQTLPMSRLVAINRDGSNLKLLGQRASEFDASLRQFDGSIIDWLPGQGGSVLMARILIPEEGKIGTNIVSKDEGLSVVRIDTATLKGKGVEPANRLATDFMTDGRGIVRIMAVEERRDDRLTGRIRYAYRTAASREWKTLYETGPADEFQPLAVDATTDSAYVLKKLDGRQALYRVKLGDQPTSELIASHPRVDIDGVVRSTSGERVVGYTLADEKREVVYFDVDYKALQQRLGRALPKTPLIDFIDSSADGSRILLYAGADTDAGRYYLYDRTAKQLAEVLPSRLKLEGKALASVKPVSISLPDGQSMPAYLTLPVGKEAKNLPAVVLPHGGPSARDEWGFDWLAQYLAARGYVVLQPNYRGSAGYGEQWMQQNGFRGWQTSIGDVIAGTRWLARQGYADPSRIAIVGWSYGGYAALQAAAVEPSLFKAVAAIAPVTDLALLKSEAEGWTSSRIVRDFVGSGPHVREGSPLQRAGAIKVPVLLAHGDLDINVGISHSVKMDKALRDAGTDVQFLRYKDLDHQLEDGTARTELLRQIGALLGRTIGT